MLKRTLACLFVVAMAIVLNVDSAPGEAFFCAVIGFVGAVGFFLIRPSVSIVERLRLVGIGEMMIPVLLMVYWTVQNPSEMSRNIKLLVFMFIFFSGASVGVKLLLGWRNK